MRASLLNLNLALKLLSVSYPELRALRIARENAIVEAVKINSRGSNDKYTVHFTIKT